MALRDLIRNFLYPMTFEQMEREYEISVDRGDTRRAMYVREYIEECKKKDQIVRNLTPEKIENIKNSLEVALESDQGEVYDTVEIEDSGEM